MKQLLGVISLSACLFSLAACGSGRSITADQAGAAGIDNRPAPQLQFPAPSELARQTSGGPEDYQRLVKAQNYTWKVPDNRVSSGGGGGKSSSSLGSTLIFSPAWDPSAAPELADAAFCGFEFVDANGYSGPAVVQYGWVVEPADYGKAYVALANFVTDRWDWYPMEADGSTEIGSWEPYAKDLVGDHSAFLAVVLLGTDEAELDWVLQGGPAAYNMIIASDLNSDPALNLAPLTVNFDLSFARIIGGTFAGIDWDFDDDGTFEVSDDQDGLETFVYSQPGNYRCRARIRATDGHEEQDILDLVAVNPANTPPAPSLVPDQLFGDAPLPVSFDASASTDDGQITLYEWDFDSDGDYEQSGPALDMADFLFARWGVNTVTLRLTDNDFATATASVDINLTTGWRLTTIDTGVQLGRPLSMCVGGSGPASRPCVLYQDIVSYGLFFARAMTSDGGIWSSPVEPVDNSGFVGEASDLIFNPTLNAPQLVYSVYEIPDYRLYFCTSSNDSGTVWNAPAEVEAGADLGSACSLALSAGDRPMLACVREGHSSGDGSLTFFRATTPAGGAWSAATEVDGVPTDGFFSGLDLLLVDGAPMVSLGISASPDYSFGLYRAQNADGSAWNGLQTLVQGIYGVTSLQLAQGRPALALGDRSSGSPLLFLRAADAGGTDWPATPQELEAPGHGGWCCMAIVSGVPAIAYRSFAEGSLKYIQALDAGGAAWFAPQTIEASLLPSDYCALVNSNGHPVVTYGDSMNRLQCAWFQN